MKKTVKQLYARLTEVEKMDIRRASPDRLQWLSLNTLMDETGKDVAILKEVQTLCKAEVGAMDARPIWWHKPTWKF